MDFDQFMHNTMLNLIDYRDNCKMFPDSEESRFIDFCMRNLKQSKSQLLQDLFVLYELREKPDGFFVEFGATNGIELSNTYLLEKRYQWSGILAEPAACWRDALRRNRSSLVDARCVWARTGERIEFNESADPVFSTVETFSESDHHAAERRSGRRYAVDTVSLIDLLRDHQAPRNIDYLSVDTEGSELDILSAFDFNTYHVKLITVEHNYTETRQALHDLLSGRGYVRKFEGFSRWDDWYVKL